MTTKCPKCQTDNLPNSKFCSLCGLHLDSMDEIPLSQTETIESPQEKLSTGTIFAGRYQIIEELGKGGMGRVYRVLDKEINEEIALKLIKPEIASDKNTIERFKNELKLARKISQKNVGKMYEFLEDKGTRFITMEYVRGGDLKKFIRRSKRLDTGTAISIAKQICEGLSEAHSLGIVHRDLKPNNIMIDDHGNARIMDFGIARTVKGKGITGSGVMIGTPEYMSPEQAEAAEVDQRSDIYSFGIILYEMLTDRLPFEGNTPLAVAMKHKAEFPKDPQEYNFHIPDALSGVVLKCLEKERERRFQNADDIRSELEKIERDIPTVEDSAPKRTTNLSKKARDTFGRRKLLIPILAFAAIVIGILILFVKRSQDLEPGRVAVAVFENKTGNDSLNSVGSMAGDWISQGLVDTGLMEVVPTSTVETVYNSYSSGDVIKFLARETRAGIIVSGSYYTEGNSVRFQSQITDAIRGKILRAMEPISVPLDNPLAAIEALRLNTMAVLANHFEPLITEWAAVDGKPQNYEAYLEFLEGGKLFITRRHKEAAAHFEKAIELDPGFTSPLFMGAVNCLNLGDREKYESLLQRIDQLRETLGPNDRIHLDWLWARQSGDNNGCFQASLNLVTRNPGSTWEYQLALDALKINRPKVAVEALSHLDPSQGLFKDWYPYWNVLTSAFHLLGDHKYELKAARRARKQFPDHLPVMWYELRGLAAQGKFEDVDRGVEEAPNLSVHEGASIGSLMRLISSEYRYHGYREESIEAATKAVTWYESQQEGTYSYSLARAMILAERWKEAKSLFDELLVKSPENPNYIGSLGTLEARLGNVDKARALADQLKTLEADYLYGNHTYWRACIFAILGETREATELLRASLQQGVTFARIHADMDLEPLYEVPEFKVLVSLKK